MSEFRMGGQAAKCQTAKVCVSLAVYPLFL